MKDKRVTGRLYLKMLQMTLLPMFLMGLVIVIISTRSFVTGLNKEARSSLMDLSVAISSMYEQMYPGDYYATEESDGLYFYKGEHLINGDFAVIDALKEKSGVEISVLYQDVRVITTLVNAEGQRMIGTKVNAVVAKDVLEGKQAVFYTSVYVGENSYFAYYAPLLNADGSCVGMLFVAKPSAYVKGEVYNVVIPFILAGILSMLLAGFVTIRFSSNLTGDIKKLEIFLGKIGKGNLNEELDYGLSQRKDEIGALGNDALRMQRSLSDLVEKDVLTGLYNRRCANNKLVAIHNNKIRSNTDFCVCIGDIDFFKKVNDTYGHEWGDIVLKESARIMKQFMAGKGFVARWGGEEFLIVFTDCPLEIAIRHLWEMLENIRDMELEYKRDQKIRITMSLGFCRGSEESLDELLNRADKCLYYAKEHGRNQVISYEELEGLNPEKDL